MRQYVARCVTFAGMGVALMDICWGSVPYYFSLRRQHAVCWDTYSGHSPSRCLSILTGQAGSQVTSVCLAVASGLGIVQASHGRTPTACDTFDFTRSPVLMTFKYHNF